MRRCRNSAARKAAKMQTPNEVFVLGAGGHSRVVVSTLQASGYSVRGVLDDNPKAQDADILGVPIVGPIGKLAEYSGVHAVIAIGENQARQRIALQFPQVHWATPVHPAAYVHPSAILGAGTVVFAGAVIQPLARVGVHCIVNTGATVDHECVLGDFVHVGPGVHLSGTVQLEVGVFMGTGSATVQGVRVGAWTTVGAGGVVVKNLDSHLIAMGIPARVARRLKDK